jgi:hypothetical protein
MRTVQILQEFSMDANGFLLVIVLGIGVILISKTLDLVWAQVVPIRIFYYFLYAPGVIVHECSHVLGCLLTGAKIRKIELFSEGGGSVTYNPPVIPLIGNVVISTAPLFCVPLVLTGCTWIFSTYLDCSFPALPLSLDSADALMALGAGIFGMFIRNLVLRFNAWFLLYLYLTLSLILSIAPSLQDTRNAATGICMLALAGIIVFWSRIPWAVSILVGITRTIGIGFTLGLGFGLIALLISYPLIIWFVYRHAA